MYIYISIYICIHIVALPNSGWLSEDSQLDMLSFQYRSVNLAAGESPGDANW